MESAKMLKPYPIFFVILLTVSFPLKAQDSVPLWDNLFWVGNKVSWGNTEGDWKYSGELQFRTNNNMQSLDRWFIEGVASYLASEKWEFQADFRLSVVSDRYEYRPGLGVLYKMYPSQKVQIAHQLKGQLDFRTDGKILRITVTRSLC